MTAATTSAIAPIRYLTIDQVCELIPGMTRGKLASLRFKGTGGPRYYKPTPRTVLYDETDVTEWVASSGRTCTAGG